jgi:Yip1 domain
MSDQSTSGGHIDGVSSTPPKPAAWWEDYIDIFYDPSAVFARRATASFFVPLLVVTVLIGGIFLANSSAMQPIMDAEFTRSMAATQKANPNVTAEQMAMGRSIGEKFAKVGAFIFVPIAIFLVGLVLWLVGKIFDAKQTFGAALMVAAYAYIPKVVEAVVGGVQLLLLDPAQLTGRLKLSLGVGRFLDPDGSPMMLALLGRVDVFTIWVTILLGIGLSVTGKIPRSKAMIAAAVVWFVGAVPAVLGALRQ